MFYEDKIINFNEVEDFNSSQILNNPFENEIFLNPFSNENTELNLPSPEISTLSKLQNSNIHIIQVPNQIPKEKTQKGRKKKNSGEIGEHDEYAEDNLIRKSKKLFRDAIFELINQKIADLKFQLTIKIDNKEYNVKRLLNLGQTITKELSVEENIALFECPVKIILYEISGKYKNYPKNYNMAVIEELCINPNCQEIADILNLDYLDCLQYYRRDKEGLNEGYLGCLKGLKLKFDNLPKKLKDEGHDESYEEALIYVIKNIENIYYDKTSRERRK